MRRPSTVVVATLAWAIVGSGLVDSRTRRSGDHQRADGLRADHLGRERGRAVRRHRGHRTGRRRLLVDRHQRRLVPLRRRALHPVASHRRDAPAGGRRHRAPRRARRAPVGGTGQRRRRRGHRQAAGAAVRRSARSTRSRRSPKAATEPSGPSTDPGLYRLDGRQLDARFRCSTAAPPPGCVNAGAFADGTVWAGTHQRPVRQVRRVERSSRHDRAQLGAGPPPRTARAPCGSPTP